MKKFAKAKVNVKVNKPIDLEESSPGSPTENAAQIAAQDIEKAFADALSLTAKQYRQLFELRYPSGELIITGILPDMDDDEIERAISTSYEIIAMIKKHGFDEVYALLREARSYEDIVLDSKFMEKSKRVLDFERDIIRDIEHEVEESGVICKKCGGKQVNMTSKQTRSADEPMTNFYTCFNPRCGHHWTS
jgi:DNA-directed RNA polymerase subunit M/transcription elongation factor TFIIS